MIECVLIKLTKKFYAIGDGPWKCIGKLFANTDYLKPKHKSLRSQLSET